MGKTKIRTHKNHKLIVAELHYRDTFKLTKVYDRLPVDRFVGLDTESFQNRDYGATWNKGLERYEGALRTNLIPLDFSDPSKNVIIETRELDYPVEPVFDTLLKMFGEVEENPSRTKQRPKRERKDGSHRDGRRQWVEPVVLIMFNLEYDLGRLFRNHPQFQRAVSAMMDSVRVQVGKYEVEIVQLTPSGNAASFEMYVRYNHKIIRVIGRDAWGYIKGTLEEAAACFLDEHKEEMDDKTFLRLWEELTTDELARIKNYAAKDARLTRELYEMLITILTNIDKHVICRNGLLPKSVAGAAAKMAFSMAVVDEWKRPDAHVMGVGAMTYAGGRVFNRKPGLYDDINTFDVESAHGFAMMQLPDPCTCYYIDIPPGKYGHKYWRGQWGCMLIDGEGLDPYYPALRDHDHENLRLRYIFGPFKSVWATIPEIVYGVESERLRVDYIRGGIWMSGTNETSFLRKHVMRMYDIKKNSPKGSPLYVLSKYLINTVPGKLAEVNLDRPYIHLLAGAIPVPYVRTTRSKPGYKALLDSYIRGGEEELFDEVEKLCHQYPDAEQLPFQLLSDEHVPNSGKAGAYYLPMHAAQITGLTSARLGLAAFCTNAISGHTDSLFVIGDQSKWFEVFRDMERAAGYQSPKIGMGSFKQEVVGGHGVLLKGNLYAIRYNSVNEKTGETEHLEKVATHSLPDLDLGKTSAYDIIMHLYKNSNIHYDTKPSPRRLKVASMSEKEPGVFDSHFQLATVKIDPNMTLNNEGEQVWKPYHNNLPVDTSQFLSHNTLPPNINRSRLHDATK